MKSGAPAPLRHVEARGAPPTPPLGTRELLDARVVAVGDEDVPAPIHGYARRSRRCRAPVVGYEA
jgi:hypothetical protein